MADPISPRNAHVNATLSTFASKYENSQFIADTVSPPMIVDKESNSFQKRRRIDQATIFDDAAGPRMKLNEVTYGVDNDAYLCRPRGLVGVVPEALVLNADAPLDPRQQATQTVMQNILLARELRVATKIMTSGNWASANTANASDWTNPVTGTPRADLKAGRQAIPFNGDDVSVYGVCSDVVFDILSDHPDFLSLRAGGGTDSGPIGVAEFAKMMNVQGMFISSVYVNTAAMNAAGVYSRVWGTTTFAWVVVPKVMASTEQMVFMPTFRANLPGSVNGLRVREWHNPEVHGGEDVIAVELKDDEKIVQDDAGFLFTGVTS